MNIEYSVFCDFSLTTFRVSSVSVGFLVFSGDLAVFAISLYLLLGIRKERLFSSQESDQYLHLSQGN